MEDEESEEEGHGERGERRRMGQQHTDVTFCVTSSYPVDGCRAPSRL